MYKIRLIQNTEEFEKLHVEWNGLLKNSSADSIFNTWEWLFSWWEIYKNNKTLFVISVRNHNNELVGLFPAYKRIKKITIPFSIKEIRFIGEGENVASEYLNFILKLGEERELLNAIFVYLNSMPKSWDCLYLSDIRIDSEIRKKIAEILLTRNTKFDIRIQRPSCPYILLPKSWDTYFKTLSKHARQHIRNDKERLYSNHKIDFVSLDKLKNISENIEQIRQLDDKRKENKNLQTKFNNNWYLNFHKKIMQRFSTNGWLLINFLLIDNKNCAYQYYFRYENKIYEYQTAFDPEYSKYGVSHILESFLIEAAITDGIREIDQLRGEEPYKFKWTDYARLKVTLNIYDSQLTKKLIFCSERFFRDTRKKIKSLYTLIKKAKWKINRNFLKKLKDKLQKKGIFYCFLVLIKIPFLLIYENKLYILTVKQIADLNFKIKTKFPIQLEIFNCDNFHDVGSLMTLKGWNTEKILFDRLDRGEVCYLAKYGKSIVGYLWIRLAKNTTIGESEQLRLKENEGYFYDVFVLEEYRGGNIYPALLSYMLEDLRIRGYKRVFALTRVDNFAALRSKGKLDFVKTNIFVSYMRFLWYKKVSEIYKDPAKNNSYIHYSGGGELFDIEKNIK